MANTTLYIIESDYGRIGTDFTGERTTRQRLVEDIADAQYEYLIRVLEIVEDEGTCRDVTEDIALDVREHLHREWRTPCEAVFKFIDRHCAGVIA